MRIIFTVTNELNFDQRMIRICNSLIHTGSQVKIIGVKFKNSSPLQEKKYQQKRLRIFFKKGFGFYFEYNIRLSLYLLFQKADIFCCIDIDTMIPVFLVSGIKSKKRVYDAHEYFSQQKEIITRPAIYRVWHFIERVLLPKFLNGYTVSQGIAKEFLNRYGVQYEVIRNVPLLKPLPGIGIKEKIILYRGNVNEGRGFEFLIPAMKNVKATLVICGEGNYLSKAKILVEEHELGNSILFKGKFLPDELDELTMHSYIGVNFVEPLGQNQILSLANKFFDYMHNAIPQVTMNFPEYKKINDEYEVAILIDELSITAISNSLNLLLTDKELYNRLQQNCLEARKVYNWENEEKKLIAFYDKVAGS
ncbi:MAG: glycosyltransferase [Bacteroidota bacterium]|nr:glycosyltransferase [Bacteroidota bacterium]